MFAVFFTRMRQPPGSLTMRAGMANSSVQCGVERRVGTAEPGVGLDSRSQKIVSARSRRTAAFSVSVIVTVASDGTR